MAEVKGPKEYLDSKGKPIQTTRYLASEGAPSNGKEWLRKNRRHIPEVIEPLFKQRVMTDGNREVFRHVSLDQLKEEVGQE